MKEQYVGDIGDFGKVLILKHLAGHGFKIGVNWVLTPNDNGADGKHRDYVAYRGVNCLCCCDEIVFEQIISFAKKKKEERRIEDLENLIQGFSPDVIFYPKPKIYFINGPERRKHDKEAFGELTPGLVDVVFFDPDNGIYENDGTSCKHVYISDLRRYWDRGQSLLIYHHLGKQKSHEKQIQEKARLLKENFSGSSVYFYRLCRGTARVYLLCIQPHHKGKILGKTTIPSLEPLMMTKSKWHKIGKHCNKDHSAKPAYSCNTTLFLNGAR
jgi:hypothetical protein